MSFDIPEDRRYLETHEWVATEGDVATIGISEFAQDELGDIVFVELPSVGETVTAGDQFGTVESIKAVSDLYAPITGTVTEVNDALTEQPELVNEDPFGAGWMLRVEPAEDDDREETLSPEEYRETIA